MVRSSFCRCQVVCEVLGGNHGNVVIIDGTGAMQPGEPWNVPYVTGAVDARAADRNCSTSAHSNPQEVLSLRQFLSKSRT
eukprot:4127627-Amphidinium_carterae.1